MRRAERINLPTLASREACSGCTACKAICPKDAITMVADEEGFLRPQVDAAKCVGCHRCEQVCPVLHPGEPDVAPICYAAYTKDENLRLKSSSGGLFTELAKPIIAAGGGVFGGVWGRPTLKAIHAKAETLEALAEMRGSKYVQSDLRETFRGAKTGLLAGRQVLFSGTPCQIAGLNAFLGKRYDNLLLVEIICHGTPSPRVLEAYLGAQEKRLRCDITEIFFRSKRVLRARQGDMLEIHRADGGVEMCPLGESSYAQAYFGQLCSRLSCYQCSAREGRSGADMTIGDFWGIEKVRPEWQDPRGVSVVVVHSARGRSVLSDLATKSKIVLSAVDSHAALQGNPSYARDFLPARKRRMFLRMCSSVHFDCQVVRCLRGPWAIWMVKRVFRRIKRLVRG